MRLRIVCVAAIASLVIALIGVPAAGAANGTSTPPKTPAPPLYTLHVTGVAKNGKKFNGTYGIQRFVVATLSGKRGVYALGTLKGRLKGRHVTRYNVLMPASLTGSGGSAHDAQATSCPVLHLVLGPINLNLLGLVVKIGGGTLANQPIVVDITAVPGPGNLLGNLLCDLTNSLNGSGILTTLSTELQQLQATLNSLISLLGSL
jgi:hypothetical protein